MPSDSENTLKYFLDQLESVEDPAQAWISTRKWFEYNAMQAGKKDPTQGWRSVSGRVFENACKGVIQKALQKLRARRNVQVMLWDEVPQNVKDGALSERVWVRNDIREPQIVHSLVDVVTAIIGERGDITTIPAVFSCKTSVRERYQQDLFWAEKFRSRGIRFCFATIDDGFISYASGNRTGSADKSITLSKALYDRVYLLTNQQITEDPEIFRPLDTVGADLKLWLAAT